MALFIKYLFIFLLTIPAAFFVLHIYRTWIGQIRRLSKINKRGEDRK